MYIILVQLAYKISLFSCHQEESIEEDEHEEVPVRACASDSSPSTRHRARFDLSQTRSQGDTSQSEDSDHSRSSSLDRTESPVSRMQPITMRRNPPMRPLKTVSIYSKTSQNCEYIQQDLSKP